MNEMIERVAKVISSHGNGGGAVWPHDMRLARAVIEAMREPTEEMNEAGSGFVQSEFAWEAMIDAALK